MQLALLTEVRKNHQLTLPDDFNLDRYCYDFCSAMANLYSSAIGENVYEWHWTGTEEQSLLIRKTRIWKVFNCIYSYAEFGCLDELCFDGTQWNFDDDNILYAVEWVGSLLVMEQTTDIGFDLNIGKYLIHKFLARYKLDGNSLDKSDYVISNESHFLPLVHPTRLTLFEVALLAGVGNLRSIRNATYDKDSPLNVIKEGRNVSVEISEARRWLKNRRGFVPTPGIDYEAEIK